MTISAVDPGSGVKAVFYSLDGVGYSLYTGPFEIQACQTPVIDAFADDMLSNRSSLVEKALPCPPSLYLPVLTR